MSNVKEVKETNYEDLKDEVERPFSERSSLSIGRGGKAVVPRKYHLTDEQLKKLKEEHEVGGAVNPFKHRVGLYNAQVEALIQLGVNEWHSLKNVVTKIEEVLTALPGKDGKNAWEVVVNRSSKSNAIKPKDINGRIIQNFKVLQRVGKGKDKNPYGYKLAQVCECVDIKFEPMDGASDISLGTWYYRLNTNFDKPEDVEPYYHNPVAKRGRRKKKKD